MGPRPPGLDINHKNGIKIDNRAASLEYVFHIDNIRHAECVGLRRPACGESHGMAKLTEDHVREIKAALLQGQRQGDLARRFGVSNCTIRDIACARTWRATLPAANPQFASIAAIASICSTNTPTAALAASNECA